MIEECVKSNNNAIMLIASLFRTNYVLVYSIWSNKYSTIIEERSRELDTVSNLFYDKSIDLNRFTVLFKTSTWLNRHGPYQSLYE